MWTHKGKEFTSEMIGDYLGFVYLIVDTETNMKYIGKKLFKSTRRLKPLKGKLRKRKKIVESDWKDYFSSSETIKSLVETSGENRFTREILHLCRTKGAMSYLELLEQVHRNALLDNTYYNGIISCRINATHLKELKT